MFDLAQHIGGLKQKVQDKRKPERNEYAGPCPKCGGEDRFIVWPDEGHSGGFWCRQCGFSGDGIEYLRQIENRPFPEACKIAGCEEKLNGTSHSTGGHSGRDNGGKHPASNHTPHSSTPKSRRELSSVEPATGLDPPDQIWQDRGYRFVRVCEKLLWEDTQRARSARSYLKSRGFSERTIRRFSLGLNPQTQFDNPDNWGLDRETKIWVPRGIVISWIYDSDLWGVNIRRPDGDIEPDANESWKTRKYHRIAGTQNALYNAEWLDGRPVALVEGEFDAMAIDQETDEVVAVATGSTSWGRTPRWQAQLRPAPIILACFDAEEAGRRAATYWTREFGQAYRWAPQLHDANEMLEAGEDIARWIEAGLDEAVSSFG